MFLRNPETMRSTAAWRLSIWTTLAFGLGTAIAFAIIHLLVANSIQQRTDAWLRGEAAVLAEVAMNTPQDHLYSRIVEEVAELATREVSDEGSGTGFESRSVFFAETSANGSLQLWIGPSEKEEFLRAITQVRLGPGVPQTVRIGKSESAFRVVANRFEGGNTVYLGLVDRAAAQLLGGLTRRFLMIWVGMLALGFLIAYTGARRMLNRVEQITETVAQIGTEDLRSRLPDAGDSDEISRLALTFNQMLDRIQSSVKQLHNVTGAVAHDLKSPVTSIRGRLELVLSKNDDTAWREPVAESVEGLDRIMQLLNTTLDLAEAEAGALHLNRERIDLSLLIRQLVDLYQPALAERQLDIETLLTPEIIVSGDSSLLNRTIGNLLDNELTHLPSRSHIAVSLTSNSSCAILRIHDDGPGFSAEVKGRAFERFVKSKRSPGHGLGLAFVDAVVRVHGGSISVSDPPDGGVELTIGLPLAASTELAEKN